MRDYYVYVHCRGTETYESHGEVMPVGAVFYCGKGRHRRGWSTRDRNSHWHRIVKKHKGFTVRVVAAGLTEEEAFAEEKRVLASVSRQDLRRGLANITDGGEGGSKKEQVDENKCHIQAFHDCFGRFPSRFGGHEEARLSRALTGYAQPSQTTFDPEFAAWCRARGFGDKAPYRAESHHTAAEWEDLDYLNTPDSLELSEAVWHKTHLD